ncbi:hypothetical protein QTG54_002223 [Skeletonema marinoi]|uniref:Uncharacterized protein n=1 Tax=Skeletonema marinoi TaxID=267567 RepID=A0AAD9DI29_9STRA|nr:hypothetical protein QTG54_002223 [Skeletonema marinoi]
MTMKVKDVPVITSPPRIKRLVPCRSFDEEGSRVNKTAVMDSLFGLDGGEVFPCDVGGRRDGRVGTHCLPMSYERQEVDEEACIGGGCYYNMDRPSGMSSNSLSYKQRRDMKATGGCASSSTDMCRRYYPFPFILMCLLFLFGLGEMLRKVSATPGGAD